LHRFGLPVLVGPGPCACALKLDRSQKSGSVGAIVLLSSASTAPRTMLLRITMLMSLAVGVGAQRLHAYTTPRRPASADDRTQSASLLEPAYAWEEKRQAPQALSTTSHYRGGDSAAPGAYAVVRRSSNEPGSSGGSQMVHAQHELRAKHPRDFAEVDPDAAMLHHATSIDGVATSDRWHIASGGSPNVQVRGLPPVTSDWPELPMQKAAEGATSHGSAGAVPRRDGASSARDRASAVRSRWFRKRL
jgi:hypothetical protein